MRKVTLTRLLCVAALAFGSTACVEVGLPADGDQTHAPLWPIFGMHDDPAFEDQQRQDSLPGTHPEGLRYPAPETVPRNHRRTAPQGSNSADGNLANPVPITSETLRYGKLSYEKTCATCHGDNGKGNGPVAGPNKIQNVPSISSATAAAQDYSDARLYRIISHGFGRMWSYKSQLEPMERWAVVNYLRALQRANNPEPWDRK
jgi:mono/diheme cytochrome c family protein